MRRFVRTYWTTAIGLLATATCVVVAFDAIGNQTVGMIAENAIVEKGEHFAALLEELPRTTTTLLTGISRTVDQEIEIRRIAALGGIENFAVYATDGRETFRSGSDQQTWLLRDRPGGMTSANRLAASLIDENAEFPVVYDDRYGPPCVILPLFKDGRVIGYVSVIVDASGIRLVAQQALSIASGKLLLILTIVLGLPLLIYVRRKHIIAKAADHIDFLANRDPLTRLLNGHGVEIEIERFMAGARGTRRTSFYCCISIDDLHEVNHAFGQAQGDKLMQIVANRLASSTERTDLVARTGANDFVLFYQQTARRGDIAALISGFRKTISEPMDLNGHSVRPQISIGVARMPQDGKTQVELAKHAKVALTYHKATRAGDFVEFELFMDAELERRHATEALIRHASATNGFELAYQPIMNGTGTAVMGFEALLRLPDGNGGFVPPATFIPIAEERGYIKDIGTWVLQEAMRQAARWPDHLFVAVNLSVVQFRDGDLIDIVREALAKAGVSSRRLEVEVVESLILDRSESVLSQLSELKELGVSIGMDDFGTGYSSLGYLWKFPFDKLKIDRSFMVAFDECQANVPEIVQTIISMAHSMNLKVTAEGVETKAQADLLCGLECDQIQGFYYGRPMPADQIDGTVLQRPCESHEKRRNGSAQPAIS